MGEPAANEPGTPAGDDVATPAMARGVAETRRRPSNPDLGRRSRAAGQPIGRRRRLLTAAVVAAMMTMAGIGAWLLSGGSPAATDDDPLPVAVLAGASTTTTSGPTTSGPTTSGPTTSGPTATTEDAEDAEDGTESGAPDTVDDASVSCDEWYVPGGDELVAAYVQTTTAAYNLRRAPLADDACQRDVIMPHGATIRITAERGDWRYIQDDLTGELGWVDTAAFDPDNPTTSVPTPICSEWFVPIRSDQVSVYEVTTTTDYNVRRAPLADDACRRGQILPAGSSIRILAERGPWRYMNHPLNNDLGWIHIDVIEG